jgi:uncharacterized repeat protein (TIGR03803 family)
MNYKRFLGAASAALMIIIAILMLAPGAGAASKYKTLYKFSGGKDGKFPQASLIFDQAGNLYGTTAGGGAHQWGIVFQLVPNLDGSWKENVLHQFTGGNDGGEPLAGLIFDQAGNLYGTTTQGGTCVFKQGCGVVFKLTPKGDGTWTESVIHSFKYTDGATPTAGVVFDPAGNLYGTTSGGGAHEGAGTVFKLAHNPDGSWTESVLHNFCSRQNCSDGVGPEAGLVFDLVGNLYGTTGKVFKLTPNPDGSWTESVLHSFCSRPNCGDEELPEGSLIFDQAGNLYGTTLLGGVLNQGTVFKLTPNADGRWTESVLHSFCSRPNCGDGERPLAGLIFDQAGNLYGTTFAFGDQDCFSGDGCGVVFKLTPNLNGGWKEAVLCTPSPTIREPIPLPG